MAFLDSESKKLSASELWSTGHTSEHIPVPIPVDVADVNVFRGLKLGTTGPVGRTKALDHVTLLVGRFIDQGPDVELQK